MAKKKRAQPGKFKCDRCDRTFSMKAHIARHMATIHATPGQKAAAKQRRAKTGGRPGPKPGRPAGRPVGRPSGVASRVGLRAMSLEEIGELISAAKAEARIKISELQAALS